MENVKDTLNQRGEVYGSFEVGTTGFAGIIDNLKKIFVDKNRREPTEKEFLPIYYLVMKLVRLGATPDHIDSWHDIQGYAKLTEDMYKKYKFGTDESIPEFNRPMDAEAFKKYTVQLEGEIR